MKFNFTPHIIDTNLLGRLYAQTALVDLDGDGCLEFITGEQYGALFWYKHHAPDRWTRHLLGERSSSDVGGCALDVDGDFDVFSCAMAGVSGESNPCRYIWENLDGKGGAWPEHIV